MVDSSANFAPLHVEPIWHGGDPKAQQCGWLKDKFGLSWQIVPTVLPELVKDQESPKGQRVMVFDVIRWHATGERA